MGAVQRVKESWNSLVGNTKESFTYIANSEPDEHLWKSMGTSRKAKNLPSVTQEHAMDYAHYFYKSNPIAKRIIDLTAEYVVGDGITYVAEDRNVQ